MRMSLPMTLGAAYYALAFGSAAALWQDDESVPMTRFPFLGILVLGAALAAVWSVMRSDAQGRREAVWASLVPVLAGTALAILAGGVGRLGMSQSLPVEVFTLAFFLVLSLPLTLAAGGVAGLLAWRRKQTRAPSPAGPA